MLPTRFIYNYHSRRLSLFIFLCVLPFDVLRLFLLVSAFFCVGSQCVPRRFLCLLDCVFGVFSYVEYCGYWLLHSIRSQQRICDVGIKNIVNVVTLFFCTVNMCFHSHSVFLFHSAQFVFRLSTVEFGYHIVYLIFQHAFVLFAFILSHSYSFMLCWALAQTSRYFLHLIIELLLLLLLLSSMKMMGGKYYRKTATFHGFKVATISE